MPPPTDRPPTTRAGVPGLRPARAATELAALARLAVPMAAATAGQALMGFVDTAVAGRAGATTLAGTGLGNALYFAFAIFASGLVLGLEPLVAQAIGAGDAARARRWLWQGAWLSLAIGVAVAAPLALVPLALGPAGIEPEVARAASAYLWLRLPGLPGFLFYFAARAYVQGLGRTRPVVVAVVVANVANLGLAVLLVFGGAALPAWAGPLRLVPALGAGGAGLATTIVTWLQAGLLALAVARAGPRVSRRPARADLARALRVGLPVGLHMGAEVGVFALVGLLAGRLGPSQVAAHQLAIAWASLSFCAALGIGNAGGVRVGWAVGAHDRAAARRAGLVAFVAGGGFMTLSALAFFAFPDRLARLLTDDPAVLATAAPLLVVAAVFQVSDGVQGVGAGVLRGAGDTRFTFAANMVGHWLVGLPLALALGLLRGLGVVGLWWGLCAGLSAVAVALLARFLRISAREIRPVEPAVARDVAGG
jgi:MATE family multidrug resistance protein